MRRLLLGSMVVFGLVLTAGCFSRSSEPVNMKEKAGRQLNQNAKDKDAAGGKAAKDAKSGGMVPSD